MYLELKSVKVFCLLMAAVKDDFLTIENEPLLRLTMELLNEQVPTPYGMAKEYSLCHSFIQEGDLMREPEMRFLVLDERTEERTGIDNVKIIPLSFRKDTEQVYDEGIESVDDACIAYFPHILKNHTDFANTWLQNICTQGFLDHLNN